jgi:hypothetical protein
MRNLWVLIKRCFINSWGRLTKKVLSNNKRTQKYLKKLPKIYVVACWARFGVREYPFTGKFIKDKYRGDTYVPLVYDYDDCNGTSDNYYLRKLTNTTTGIIIMWTQNKNIAEKIAAMYNQHMV